MPKPKKDPVREDRIHNEAIVDAYGPEEQALGWYYYLENKIRFPFQAECIRAKVVSPLLKGERVEVRRLAPEDACTTDLCSPAESSRSSQAPHPHENGPPTQAHRKLTIHVLEVGDSTHAILGADETLREKTGPPNS
jgi:hypothetical protein